MAIPPFAVHCCLYNITPKNQVWSKQATQLMVQIIDKYEFQFFFVFFVVLVLVSFLVRDQ